MAETFPAGYNLDRSSTFTWSSGVKADIMDDGGYAQREIGVQTVTIEAKYKYLTKGEADTLQSFVLDNAAEYILYTPESTLLIGTFVGDLKRVMIGPRYNISFKYYGQVFSI